MRDDAAHVCVFDFGGGVEVSSAAVRASFSAAAAAAVSYVAPVRPYKSILDPVTGVMPRPERTVADMEQWGRSVDGTLWMGYRAKGAMVKDADINAQRKGRSGVRAVGTAGQSGLSWGAHREKKNTDEVIAAMPVHASLDGAKQRIIAKAIGRSSPEVAARVADAMTE